MIQVKRTKKVRGRPKITLVEVVKKEMWIKEITEAMTSNIIEWNVGKNIYLADLN